MQNFVNTTFKCIGRAYRKCNLYFYRKIYLAITLTKIYNYTHLNRDQNKTSFERV